MPFLMVYLHSIRHVSLVSAGIVLSVSSIVGFASAPVAGSFIDKIGSLRALIGASILLCLGTCGYAVSTELPVALTAAAITGLGNVGMWTALSARMAVLTERPNRSRAFGIAYAVQNLGLGLGSGVAGLMLHGNSESSYVFIFLLDAATYLLFIPFVFATRQPVDQQRESDSNSDVDGTADHIEIDSPSPGGLERVTKDDSSLPVVKKAADQFGLRHVLRDGPLVAAATLNLLYVTFGFSQLNSSFSTWATTGAGAGASITGIAFFANCIVIAIVQIPVLRWTEGWRRTRLAMTCGVCFASCWIITFVASQHNAVWTDIWLILALIVFGVGETFLSPSLVPLINDLAPDELRGRYNALFTISWQAGTAIGPLIAGFGIAASGRWLFVFLASACLVPTLGSLWMERMVPPMANRS